jgi:hypothetical protein
MLLLVVTLGKSIPIYGFDDFCYDEICYDNPSKGLTLSMGGQVVEVDWDAVEALPLKGPGLGIGLDPSTERAYINEYNAGDYECGHLFARLLEAHPCSLFVHIPQEPGAQDIMVIKKALSKIRTCMGE